MIGQTIAHYRITAKLGEGGMGEVYRATDTKLGRDVALKILPPSFAADADRMARFEREAKVLAALNHPHIAQIYGIEDRALVMELVEGETVDALIKPGPLPLDTALEYADQIAEALEAAHEKGIVHRDLKPANIKVTPQGVLKVLDFGLAAVTQPPADPSNATISPTLTMSPTRAGMILGTAAYMPPEQARGKPSDKRADIWAFGVVLYEMLTGRKLFHGETITDILASVVKEEPDLTQIPPKFRRLLRACLQKDPKQRLQAIGDWRLLLDPDDDESVGRNPSGSPHKRWLWPSIAMLSLAALGVLLFSRFREKPPPAPELVRFQISPPERTNFGDHLVLSPDGRRIAFSARGQAGRNLLWVRNLDSLESQALPRTEGATRPFWSPDSRFLGFADGTRVKKIDLTGGPPVTVCELPQAVGFGSWSAGGVLLMGGAGTGPLWQVAASGGTPVPVSRLDPARREQYHSQASFLPDGRHFVYLRSSLVTENSGIYVGSLDAKPEDQPMKPLAITPFGPRYAPSGDPRTPYILILREGTVSAQKFDTARLELVGEPIPVAQQVGSVNGSAGFFTASANALAFREGGEGVGEQLTWFDRQGKVLGTVGDRTVMQRPSISPDGRMVAIDRRDPQTGFFDIWLHDLTRGTASRFTSNSTNNRFPLWSPDGSHVAYGTAAGQGGVLQKAASGVGQEEVLDGEQQRQRRTLDWSRDGRYLIESALDPKAGRGIWVLPLFGDRKPFALLKAEFNFDNAKLSPNGRWLAYTSDETRRNEVYVMTFPDPGGKWPISTAGGDLPVWSRDGKELFFVGADQKMMAVEVKGGASATTFEAGVPKALFDVHLADVVTPGFDVSADGRFLIPTTSREAAAAPITVVLNWTVALK